MAKLYVSGLPHPTMDSSGKNHCNLHPQANGFKKSHQSVRGHISNNARFGLPRFFQLGKVFPNCRLWPNVLDFLPNSLRASKLPWFWRVSASFAAFFLGGGVGFGFFTIWGILRGEPPLCAGICRYKRPWAKLPGDSRWHFFPRSLEVT